MFYEKFAFCCCYSYKSFLTSQTNLPIAIQKVIGNELKSWTSCFSEFATSSFHVSDTTQMRQTQGEEFVELDSIYATYKPLFLFSPDKRYFVDSYSYQLNLKREGDHFVSNLEVDQQVLLYNTRNKTTYSLFYGGTERWIDDEVWLNNCTLILAGIEKDENAVRHPVFYIVNIATGEIIQYSCTNRLCIQHVNYRSPRLTKIKIEGL